MPNPNEPELANKLVLTFTWENKKRLKLIAHDDSETKTILQMDEDGNLAALWDGVEITLHRYFQSIMDKIGTEMKKP